MRATSGRARAAGNYLETGKQTIVFYLGPPSRPIGANENTTEGYGS